MLKFVSPVKTGIQTLITESPLRAFSPVKTGMIKKYFITPFKLFFFQMTFQFLSLFFSLCLLIGCNSSVEKVTESTLSSENSENNSSTSSSSGRRGGSGGSSGSSRRSGSDFISVCDRGEEIQKHLMCVLIQDEVISIPEKNTCPDPSDIDSHFLSNHCSTVTKNHLAQIEELRITQNVQEISANDFVHLNNLKLLFLVNIDLEELPINTFYDLPQLIFLDLSDNQLTQLQPTSFTGLNSLEELDLSENDISVLPADVFSRLGVIKEIYLNDNDLNSPINDFYSNLDRLEVLDISGNNLNTEDIERIKSAFPSGVDIID